MMDLLHEGEWTTIGKLQSAQGVFPDSCITQADARHDTLCLRPRRHGGASPIYFPDWLLPSRTVSLVHPCRGGLAPAVRAFADFMKDAGTRGQRLTDPLTG
jgi:DNA-binding transcriptional LysR family regulator